MRRHAVTATIVLVLLALTSAALAQPVLTYTLFEWGEGDDFFGQAATLARPFEGEIVETRIDITLLDVPPTYNDVPIDAADIYVRIDVAGADPIFPDLLIPRFVRATGLDFGFSGTGGPMSANYVSFDLNGPVFVSDDPNFPSFWGFEYHHTRTDLPNANYGQVRGRVEIDYIPAADPCPCETTGDDPSVVDVFDLLAYLDGWFEGDPAADLDDTPGVDVFDLLAFLDCWFPASAGAPCP